MRGSAIILIVIALLTLYLGVTGRYKCFSVFFTCINSDPGACSCGGGESSGGAGPIIVTPNGTSAINISPLLPGLPPLPTIGGATA